MCFEKMKFNDFKKKKIKTSAALKYKIFDLSAIELYPRPRQQTREPGRGLAVHVRTGRGC